MANITTYLTASKDCRVLDTGAFAIVKKVTTPTSGWASGDYIQLVTIPTTLRIVDAMLSVSATLGASCTLTLYHNRSGSRTALTGATTAGAASKVSSGLIASSNIDMQSGDIIEALIGGANISAAATVALDLLCTRA